MDKIRNRATEQCPMILLTLVSFVKCFLILDHWERLCSQIGSDETLSLPIGTIGFGQNGRYAIGNPSLHIA